MNPRILLMGALALLMTPANPASAQKVGPAKGALVIVGGNMHDPAILKRFIQLAGGEDARFVIIPTAGDADQYDQYWPGVQQFKEAGMSKIQQIMHEIPNSLGPCIRT